MPDSLSLHPKETVADLIRRHRRPLFSTTIDIENFRARAVALCSAEVAHRRRDFLRVERTLGLSFDRWLEPDCEQLGQFPHEAHAAAALLWLSHLQTHESQKRTPWSGVPFRSWGKEERTAWFKKRRTLWSGFLRQVERYHATQSARHAIEMPSSRPERSGVEGPCLHQEPPNCREKVSPLRGGACPEALEGRSGRDDGVILCNPNT